MVPKFLGGLREPYPGVTCYCLKYRILEHKIRKSAFKKSTQMVKLKVQEKDDRPKVTPPAKGTTQIKHRFV